MPHRAQKAPKEALIQYRKRRQKVPRLRRIAEKRQFCFARDDSKELNQRFPKRNLASFLYVDPLGESWLWYRKYSRAVMLPNSGAGSTLSCCCKTRNVSLPPSPLRR